MRMRSISSSVISSLVRSQSFVVRGDSWAAVAWREFCASLQEVVNGCPTIIHYTAFEITQMKAMAEDGVLLAEELLDAIRARSVDLARIVEEHVYFEEFRGRTSIKVVLPALVPGMSYKDLLIGNGTAAAWGFRRMLSSQAPVEEEATLRAALLEFCCQDTLAMVKIYRALRALRAT
jgi:hypothetical protein